jgi:hypothetical protein
VSAALGWLDFKTNVEEQIARQNATATVIESLIPLNVLDFDLGCCDGFVRASPRGRMKTTDPLPYF